MDSLRLMWYAGPSMANQHDKWILGRSQSGRRYLLHTEEPRFVAEIFGEDDDEGILSPLSYALRDGRNLANFVFTDTFPNEPHFSELLVEADRALIRVEKPSR